MNCDVNSVLQFFLLYLLLNIVEYLLGLLENVFNVLSAYLAVKLVELQDKIEPKEESDEKSISCIGFQIQNTEGGNEDSND